MLSVSTRHLTRFLLGLSLLAATVAHAAEVERLSQPGEETGAPRVATDAHGNVAVVWPARHATLPLWCIQVREKHEGGWGAVQNVCAFRNNVRIDEPAVAIGSDGTPWVAWVVSEDNRDRIDFAFRYASKWVAAQPLTPRIAPRIEHPAILFTARGELIAAWQEREGSLYRIRSGVIDAGGSFHEFTLDGYDGLKYVIYPELLALPSTTNGPENRIALCWYDLQGAMPALRMRLWDPIAKSWQETAPPDWPGLALASLPVVSSSGGGSLLLAGYETIDGRDRAFLMPEWGDKIYLEPSPDAQSRFPRLSPPARAAGPVALVWQRERAGTLELVPAVVKTDAEVTELEPIEVDSFMPPRPDVAIGQDALVIVWTGLGGHAGGVAPESRLPAVFAAELSLPSTP